MTWDELKELVEEYPNIKLIYRGKNRITVDFVTDEGLKPKPPEPQKYGINYDFETGM